MYEEMKQCFAKPYEGNKPYISIIYQKENNELVYPSIEYLQKSGFRLRFDEEEENNLEHVAESAAVLAFLSNDFFQSHACRKGFSFALMEKKPLLAVVLESITITPVLKLQLALAAEVDLYRETSRQVYYQKLVQAEYFEKCKNLDHTEISTQWVSPEEKQKESKRYVLKRQSTGETISLSHSSFQIGRSKTQCDYVIEDNLAVSRVHAVITQRESNWYLTDNYATNHVYLNEHEMEPGQEYLLKSLDHINIGGELFVLEEERMQYED